MDLVENNPIGTLQIRRRLMAPLSAGDTPGGERPGPLGVPGRPLNAGDAATLADYQQFFSNPAVAMLPMTAAVCERAAAIRVSSALKIRLPDALHLAAAVEHGCDLFLTNDVPLGSCLAIAVEVLA